MVRSSRRFFPIFLVWRKGVVFRSNSYTNRLKSRWFFPKFRDWAHALQLGRADYLLSNLVNAALLDEVTLLCQSQVNLVSDFSLQCLRYSFASKCPNLVIKTLQSCWTSQWARSYILSKSCDPYKRASSVDVNLISSVLIASSQRVPISLR